mgnify:FL=1
MEETESKFSFRFAGRLTERFFTVRRTKTRFATVVVKTSEKFRLGPKAIEAKVIESIQKQKVEPEKESESRTQIPSEPNLDVHNDKYKSIIEEYNQLKEQTASMIRVFKY